MERIKKNAIKKISVYFFCFADFFFICFLFVFPCFGCFLGTGIMQSIYYNVLFQVITRSFQAKFLFAFGVQITLDCILKQN